MTPEPTQAADAPDRSSPAGRAKYRLRFKKAGDLRLVSHHDLMHVFERMFRRAALPVRATEGFNPRPRMWFAQSLALGIAGLNEVLELELREPLPAAEVHARLRPQCPPGLDVVSVAEIAPKTSGRVRRAFFRLPLTQPVADLPERCERFLAEPHCWIERTRPHHRRIDLRPYVNALTPRPDHLEIVLWITPYGAARPEEIVEALGLIDLLKAGAVLERADLELYDELPPEVAAQPGPPACIAHKEPPPTGAGGPTERGPAASRHTPLIPSPLSFET